MKVSTLALVLLLALLVLVASVGYRMGIQEGIRQHHYFEKHHAWPCEKGEK